MSNSTASWDVLRQDCAYGIGGGEEPQSQTLVKLSQTAQKASSVINHKGVQITAGDEAEDSDTGTRELHISGSSQRMVAFLSALNCLHSRGQQSLHGQLPFQNPIWSVTKRRSLDMCSYILGQAVMDDGHVQVVKGDGQVVKGDGHIQVVKGDGHVQVVKGDDHVQVVKGDGHVQLGAACQG
ncbi:hypothetical protein EMCRGX_G015912 [Ephydatia muelleri]